MTKKNLTPKNFLTLITRDIVWDFRPKFNVDIFYENLQTYVKKKHALLITFLTLYNFLT